VAVEKVKRRSGAAAHLFSGDGALRRSGGAYGFGRLAGRGQFTGANAARRAFEGMRSRSPAFHIGARLQQSHPYLHLLAKQREDFGLKRCITATIAGQVVKIDSRVSGHDCLQARWT